MMFSESHVFSARNPFRGSLSLILLFVLTPILCMSMGFHQKASAKQILSPDRFLGNEKTPWVITARSLTYDEKEELYVAEGDVLIEKEGQSLHAEKAIYNVKTGLAEVSGNFRLESSGDRVMGETGTFDLLNQTGTITKGNLFLGENHYYISGSVMQKIGKDSYIIRDFSLTTCDGPHPDWTLTGSEVTVTLEGYGEVRHAAFRARDFPFLYLPYMIFPAKTKRQTGLLPPMIGYSNLNGGDLEVPFYWAIGDQVDATFYQRYMSRRGYMQGAELDYVTGDSSKGMMMFDILSDRKEQKNMDDHDELALSPYPRTNQTRYWLRGRADQDLPSGIVARLDADLVSDQDYLLEFEKPLFGFRARPDLVDEFNRPLEERRSPTRRSALRLSRDGESYSLQAGSSYYQQLENPLDDETAQPLGNVDFTLLQEQIRGLPAFFNISSDYDYIWRKEGTRGHRVSLSPQMNFPFWLGPYVEFEPSFRYAYDGQWFKAMEGNADNQSESGYEAKARLQSNAERFFDLQWEDVRRLRHKISPVLTYRYGGFKGDEKALPWFEPLSYERQTSYSHNLVTLALENFLDARLEDKKGRVTYHQWVYFNLEQGYAFDREGDESASSNQERPFTPLSASLIVNPLTNLDLRGDAAWNHYESGFTSANVSVQFALDRAARRKDIYRLDYGYQKDGVRNLNLWANVNLWHGFSVGGSLQRDLSQGETILGSGWLGYDTQCWSVRIGAQKEDEDTSLVFMINLLGLGGSGAH